MARKANNPQNLIPGANKNGRPKGAKSLKGMIKDILYEKMPPELFEKVRTKFKLPADITQGEMAARLCLLKAMEKGDVNSFEKLARMAGEVDDIEINNVVGFRFILPKQTNNE